jgi:hypothetical protein
VVDGQAVTAGQASGTATEAAEEGAPA